MPKLDLDSIERSNRTGYPAPYSEAMAKRWYGKLPPLPGSRISE